MNYNLKKKLYEEIIIRKPKFKTGDIITISKYQTVFMCGYQPTFTEEIFIVSEILNFDLITYRIKDLNGNEIKGTYYELELFNYNKKDKMYKIEKIMKKKGKIYLVKI